MLKSPLPISDPDRTIAASPDGVGEEASACDLEPDHPALAGGAPGLSIPPTGAAEPGSPNAFATALSPQSGAGTEVGELNALAAARYNVKDYAAASILLGRVVGLTPHSAAAHGNLAVALWRDKRVTEAETHCRRALALNRNYAPPYKILAELFRERHDIRGALACYSRIATLEPEYPVAHNNAGLLLRKVGQHKEAEVAFARALALDPGEPRIRFNYLLAQRNDASLPEAIACCRQSLEQRPDSADVMTNLAVCLHLSGRYDEALTWFGRAIALNPDHHEARFNLALLLLLCGDYARGWREYEQRWHLLEVNKPNFAQPEWQGEGLHGKTILLHSEQGLGDSIQCLRYVPAVAARGCRVVLRLERTLVRLAASLPGQIVITPTSAPVPEFDVWCPLLSLPRILGTRLDSIPAAAPYLGARPVVAERWQRRLAGLPGLKVGLVWGGSPQHVNDFRRSIELQRLKPLLEITGVSWVSLQVGPRTADLAALPAGTTTDLSAELSDFAETGGAMLNLDLVIAVDTAVAHLAGALARPAWIMLPFSPDWRWLLKLEDSPWYPTLRLYRQKAPGDWDDVVARLAAGLAERVAAHARDAAQHA